MKKNKLAFSLIELSIVILVIGILVLGVTKGSNILNKSRLESARNLTKNSPVHGIDGLSLWFETSTDDSFLDSETQDSGFISQWKSINSQTDSDFIITQSNNALKPTYVKNGINNLPAVEFSADEEVLTRDNVSGGGETYLMTMK